MSNGLTKAQELITEECDSIKELLLAKNKAYGNSAIEPIRVFSKASNIEQILVRLDDKAARLQRGLGSADEEDVIKDMIGYLILLRVCKRVNEEKA